MQPVRKDLVFGLIMLATGAVYLFLTLQLPRKAGIDSATVPFILAGIILTLGVLQTILAGRKLLAVQGSGRTEPEPAGQPGQGRVDVRTVVATAALITVYVLLLDYLGFALMSAAYLYLQFSILTPAGVKKRRWPYALIAVAGSLFIYYTFRTAFDLMLPEGELWWDLGWLD